MSKNIKLVATQSLAGIYKLPYDKGNEFEIAEKLGLEMIELNHAVPATAKTNDPAKEAAAAAAKQQPKENAADKGAEGAEKA